MVEHSKYLSRRDFFIFRFTTNGSLLSMDIIEYSLNNGIYFNISFDGIASTHDLNRVYFDGTGTSATLLKKFEMITSKDKVGIVSTYGPNTFTEMKNGTLFLIDVGFNNIGLNICMGCASEYDETNLLKCFKEALHIFTEMYKKNVFKINFIILDQVLKKIIDEYMGYPCAEINGCIRPYKLMLNGDIASCDRIHKDINKVVCSIYDDEFNSNIFMHSHICLSNKVDATICQKCTVTKYCSPCHAYIGDYYDNLFISNEYAFCAVMKTIITEALLLFENKKQDLRFLMNFSDNLRLQVQNGNFSVI